MESRRSCVSSLWAWLATIVGIAVVAAAIEDAAVRPSEASATAPTLPPHQARLVRRGRLPHQRGLHVAGQVLQERGRSDARGGGGAEGAIAAGARDNESFAAFVASRGDIGVVQRGPGPSGAISVGPGAEMGHMASAKVPEDNADKTGKELCEGHDFGVEECGSVGCCEFVGGKCWSLVGDKLCMKPYTGVVQCTLMLKVRGPTFFAGDMNALYTVEHALARAADIPEDLVTSRMRCVRGCKPTMAGLPQCVQDCKAWKGLMESAQRPPSTQAMCEVMAWCEGFACDKELGTGVLQTFVKEGCHDPMGVVEVKLRLMPPAAQSAQHVFLRLMDDNPTDDVVARVQTVYHRIAPDAYIEAVEPMVITVSTPQDDMDDIMEDDVLFDFEVTRVQLAKFNPETFEAIKALVRLVMAELTGAHPNTIEVDMGGREGGGLKVSVAFHVPEIGNKASNIGAKLSSRSATRSFIEIADKIRALAGHPDPDGGLVYCIPGATAIVKSDRLKKHFAPHVMSRAAPADSVVGQVLDVAEKPEEEKGAIAPGAFPGWVTRKNMAGAPGVSKAAPPGSPAAAVPLFGPHSAPASPVELMGFAVGSALVAIATGALLVNLWCVSGEELLQEVAPKPGGS
eukprot:TRINITY_DN40766_c0_g1_i1.p1 TRINITY_DN40766_c0_g1~~TRINITY_DN40766_c0_g1_i1.p1  ORF type:complete len:626 (+),score=146.79 TRINITY_DN40766_c0_g1_i1:189-2066(+)